MAQCKFKHQDGDAGGYQGYDIGKQKCPAAVIIGNIRKPPDIAEPYGRTNGCKQKPEVCPPLRPVYVICHVASIPLKSKPGLWINASTGNASAFGCYFIYRHPSS